jgi:hypothetical protein
MRKGMQHWCAHMCMLGTLHGLEDSAQQPPAIRLSMLELAERRSVKTWSSAPSGKAREAWSTGDRAGKKRGLTPTAGDQGLVP